MKLFELLDVLCNGQTIRICTNGVWLDQCEVSHSMNLEKTLLQGTVCQVWYSKLYGAIVIEIDNY